MKHFALCCIAIILAGCGFTPMHAPSSVVGGKAVLQNIKVNMVEPEKLHHREGAFWVEQALYERLGRHGGTHTLRVEPEFFRDQFGISAEDVASRYDMRIRVKYELLDQDGKTLDKGSVKAASAFGAPTDPYGRESAEKSAMKNIAKDAADRLIIRISSHYANAE